MEEALVGLNLDQGPFEVNRGAERGSPCFQAMFDGP